MANRVAILEKHVLASAAWPFGGVGEPSQRFRVEGLRSRALAAPKSVLKRGKGFRV